MKAHPCLNDEKVTIISDKDKGLMGAIAEVLPKAVNFMCSYHRRKNITIQVRGGSGAYSCLWYYNLLIGCSSPTVLEALKVEHAMNMDDKALLMSNIQLLDVPWARISTCMVVLRRHLLKQ